MAEQREPPVAQPQAPDADPRDGAGEAKRARARRPEGRAKRSRRRAFFSIGEVCQMLDLKPHVLRYWETQFEGLAPSKNRAGNRVYTQQEVEQIALIKRLVHDERYTIEGARLRLQEMADEGSTAEQSSQAMQRAFLRSLRGELESVLDLLDPSPAHQP